LNHLKLPFKKKGLRAIEWVIFGAEGVTKLCIA
jgi:hypothetical protein